MCNSCMCFFSSVFYLKAKTNRWKPALFWRFRSEAEWRYHVRGHNDRSARLSVTDVVRGETALLNWETKKRRRRAGRVWICPRGGEAALTETCPGKRRRRLPATSSRRIFLIRANVRTASSRASSICSTTTTWSRWVHDHLRCSCHNV